MTLIITDIVFEWDLRMIFLPVLRSTTRRRRSSTSEMVWSAKCESRFLDLCSDLVQKAYRPRRQSSQRRPPHRVQLQELYRDLRCQSTSWRKSQGKACTRRCKPSNLRQSHGTVAQQYKWLRPHHTRGNWQPEIPIQFLISLPERFSCDMNLGDSLIRRRHFQANR